MTFDNTQTNKRKDSHYASSDDFHQIFAENCDTLYQLALLLTADHEKAEQCFAAAIHDSIKSNHVFKGWAHAWAKRAIIHSAIRLLQPPPRRVHSHSHAAFDRHEHEPISQRQFDLRHVLALEVFDRFAFVMSFLERYSDYECSLLLRCFARDIRDARLRAIDALSNAVQSTSEDSTAASSLHLTL